MTRTNLFNRTALAIALTGLFCINANAQDKSPVNEKSEATIQLSYYKKADLTKTAVAIVKVKKDKKFVAAKNAQVNFYILNNKEPQLIKNASTDNLGQVEITLPKDLPADTSGSFTIVAKIENDKLYEDVEEEMSYKEANLTLDLNPKDTSHLVTAKLTKQGKDGKEIPVKGAEVKFYVQRLFGNMAASDENTITTDENGEASFNFPKNIPGDTAGNFTVTAKIEDNEQFGNIENKAATSWGTVLAINDDPFPRALIEPYAPFQLILTFSILFGGVWCTYFFIFFQLGKIKQETKISKKPIKN